MGCTFLEERIWEEGLFYSHVWSMEERFEITFPSVFLNADGTMVDHLGWCSGCTSRGCSEELEIVMRAGIWVLATI